jgi:hypothetical protein
MQFCLSQELTHPVERVFETCRDRLVELVPFLKGIDAIEVLERHEDGGRTRLVNRWRASTTTAPAIVRPFLPTRALSWIDRALWDPVARLCAWEFELNLLPEALHCAGVNHFRERPGGSLLEVTGSLTVDLRSLHIPARFCGAGPKVEAYLLGRVRPNLAAVGRAVEQFLSEENARR